MRAACPEAGGLYLHIRDAFGSLPAFLYGWTLLFLISSGSVTTLAVAFGLYLGPSFPTLDARREGRCCIDDRGSLWFTPAPVAPS